MAEGRRLAILSEKTYCMIVYPFDSSPDRGGSRAAHPCRGKAVLPTVFLHIVSHFARNVKQKMGVPAPVVMRYPWLLAMLISFDVQSTVLSAQ